MMYILAWKVARLVCSALSTVLDMAKTADRGLAQPCATQDHEWKKDDAGSFVGDIGLLVIIIDANSNKTKKVPALLAVSIAAGA